MTEGGLILYFKLFIITCSLELLDTISTKYVVHHEEIVLNDFVLITYSKRANDQFTKDHPTYASIINRKADQEEDSVIVNYALAAAVTAYSRIIIDQFKRIPDNQCYYTDTFSVFLERP
jgi:hypothetical protein